MFGSSGSGFTFNVNWAFYPSYSLTVSGAGIINNSGTTQTLVAAVDDFGDYESISFTNSASAGTLTAFTISGAVADGVPGGSAEFFNNSTAANSTFTNTRCLLPYGYGGFTAFYDTSTAGNATLIAYASRGGDGAKIDIWGDATGGTSRVKVFGSPFGDYYSGNLDINPTQPSGRDDWVDRRKWYGSSRGEEPLRGQQQPEHDLFRLDRRHRRFFHQDRNRHTHPHWCEYLHGSHHRGGR